MAEKLRMVGLGEVLWDLLPAGRVLGGAPANFAYMASLLGAEGVVATRIGEDPLGIEARNQLESLQLNTDYLQSDSALQTGTAKVSIDAAGQPTFTIGEPSAWDRLEWSSDWEHLSSTADVICFGTLAQRAPESFKTITSFLRHSRPDALRIVDINLRQSYYSRDILQHSLRHADIVKLTNLELAVVTGTLGIEGHESKELARILLREYQLRLVCITRGAEGSLLISPRECIEHPGYVVKVKDAIGAGDAFTACLAYHLVLGLSLQEISNYANRFASWVATQPGATPVISSFQVERLLHSKPTEVTDAIPWDQASQSLPTE